MTTLNDKLAKIIGMTDEKECAQAFEIFCKQHEEELPLPGENALFDKAMWNASQYMTLSKNDESILERVTSKLIGETVHGKLVGISAAAEIVKR